MLSFRNKTLLAIALALPILATGAAQAQTVSTEKLIAVVVIAKIPAGAPRAKVEEGILASVPTYQKVPGLLRKVFIVNEDSYGGMYVFASRAAAEAWFTPDFAAKVKARSGVDPQIIYFDSPVQIDNKAPRS
ncbi:MAG: monooxygenase [Gammaproteobacteria bacterium]|nr:monooxygenase [Gammaproteobacteria bacterium]